MAATLHRLLRASEILTAARSTELIATASSFLASTGTSEISLTSALPAHSASLTTAGTTESVTGTHLVVGHGAVAIFVEFQQCGGCFGEFVLFQDSIVVGIDGGAQRVWGGTAVSATLPFTGAAESTLCTAGLFVASGRTAFASAKSTSAALTSWWAWFGFIAGQLAVFVPVELEKILSGVGNFSGLQHVVVVDIECRFNRMRWSSATGAASRASRTLLVLSAETALLATESTRTLLLSAPEARTLLGIDVESG